MVTVILVMGFGALAYMVCEFYARLVRKGIGRTIRMVERMKAERGHDYE